MSGAPWRGLREHLRFERRHEALASTPHFVRRWLVYWALAVALLLVWLLAGTFLYLGAVHGDRLEAFYQAAMVASGVGTDFKVPPDMKLRVSLYAVLSGVILLGSAGAFLSPLVHRIQHWFQIQDAG